MSVIALARCSAAALTATVLAVLLSGCLLTSETLLVDPGEAVAVLPASFVMQAYNETDGVYILNIEEDSGTYTMQPDNGYLDPEGGLTAYFIPHDDGRYLLALNAKDGAIYGFARIRGDLIELGMVLDGDVPALLEAAGKTLPTGVHFEESGAIINDRAGLDAAIALVADGTIALLPLVAWIGTGEPPARLVPADDWYEPAP